VICIIYQSSDYSFYDRKIKLYNNGTIKEKKYVKILSRLKDGSIGREPTEKEQLLIEQSKAKKKALAFQLIDDSVQEIRTDNLSRTRNMIIDLASHNEHLWKSFVTLTFTENIGNVKEANKSFKIWVKQVKRYYKKKGLDFYYLGTAEYQERGAIHYHLLSSISPGDDISPMRKPLILFDKKTKKKKCIDYYDLKYWNYGYSSLYDLRVTDEQFNVALYIVKYLYKDIDSRFFGEKKVFHSYNLEKPTEIEMLSSNPVYLIADSYIKEKGYNRTEYDYQPTIPYIVPFVTTTQQLLHDDYSIIERILKEGS
jgi:hypothetical protein